jgi:hypothetical protein
MQQVLRELEGIPFYRKYGVRIRNAITALRERLAHCDRCGKRLGGEGDIHTCTPDPIGDAQDRMIAEMAAQPEKESVIFCMHWEDRWGVNHYVDPKEPHPAQAKPLYTTPPAAPVQQEPVAWRLNGESSLGHGKVFGKWKSGKPPKDVADLASVDKNWSLEFAYTTPPAAQHQCKWPTCQSEEYQQALAEQINQELVTGAAQRKPLTDEQIIEWVESGEYNVITNDWASHIEFARAIEAAHGIKE